MAVTVGIIGAGYIGTMHAKNLITDARGWKFLDVAARSQRTGSGWSTGAPSQCRGPLGCWRRGGVCLHAQYTAH